MLCIAAVWISSDGCTLNVPGGLNGDRLQVTWLRIVV
jgi:hypothetical protein